MACLVDMPCCACLVDMPRCACLVQMPCLVDMSHLTSDVWWLRDPISDRTSQWSDLKKRCEEGTRGSRAIRETSGPLWRAAYRFFLCRVEVCEESEARSGSVRTGTGSHRVGLCLIDPNQPLKCPNRPSMTLTDPTRR